MVIGSVRESGWVNLHRVYIYTHRYVNEIDRIQELLFYNYLCSPFRTFTEKGGRTRDQPDRKYTSAIKSFDGV